MCVYSANNIDTYIKEEEHDEPRKTSEVQTEKIELNAHGAQERLIKSLMKDQSTADPHHLDVNQVDLDPTPKSKLFFRKSQSIGKEKAEETPAIDRNDEKAAKTEKLTKKTLQLFIPPLQKNSKAIVALERESEKRDSSPSKSPGPISSNNSSFSANKIRSYWQKINHSVNFSQTLKGVTGVTALKKLSKHQLDLVSDFSHAQLDHARVFDNTTLRRSPTPDLHRTTGPSRLKRLLTKHAVNQKDMQGEFFAKIMVISTLTILKYSLMFNYLEKNSSAQTKTQFYYKYGL